METKLPNTLAHDSDAWPKVSIIITCYNYEKFIRTSIESVLNQDYPSIELIVVDDCSKDNSRSIISEYEDQLIPAFHVKNKGHGGAFNTGFDTATGDIVMFLDADDFLLPNSLKKAVSLFPEESGMCQFRMHLVDDKDKQFDIFPKQELLFDEGDGARNKLLYCGEYQSTVTSGLLFRRAYMEQVMPMPAESFRQGGDGYLVTLAPVFTHISSSDYCLSAYRQHGLNHSGFANQLTDRAKWLLEHNKMRHSALQKATKENQLQLQESFWYNDLNHLTQLMCLSLYEPRNTQIDLARPSLMRKAISNVKTQNLSAANKFIIAAWWSTIGLSPRAIAKPLFSWRMLASSRPKVVQKVSSILRRI
ncbi:glycosyltransferase family 2 protein [Vibrio amylolyticus]|uniref:glycosyltransferase family 2 protein n=1 Tax=Vibrio amylolyticus TaxID=2847292 RepID=UPI00354DB882